MGGLGEARRGEVVSSLPYVRMGNEVEREFAAKGSLWSQGRRVDRIISHKGLCAGLLDDSFVERWPHM